jgi:uncharacterized membrane protein YphA (DoxX/SURF4 family)
MRTNPFFDTWLFLIGSTKDHDALGWLKYVFVVLFLVYLIGALWLAWTNWREDAAQRTAYHLTIFICRLLIGCMWFQGFLWKLPLPVSGGFQYWTGELGEYAAFEFHRDLVETVFLPYIKVIDPLVFLTELSFATSLMLGFGVRFFALLAVPFCLHLWLGLYTNQAEWPWNYMFLALLHVLFVAVAAGRSLGADALLRRRQPGGLIGRFVGVAS